MKTSLRPYMDVFNRQFLYPLIQDNNRQRAKGQSKHLIIPFTYTMYSLLPVCNCRGITWLLNRRHLKATLPSHQTTQLLFFFCWCHPCMKTLLKNILISETVSSYCMPNVQTPAPDTHTNTKWLVVYIRGEANVHWMAKIQLTEPSVYTPARVYGQSPRGRGSLLA